MLLLKARNNVKEKLIFPFPFLFVVLFLSDGKMQEKLFKS